MVECRNDKRYVIEKDTSGRFTITIKVVEEGDQAEWVAKVNNTEVSSKCMVYVEEPRDAFGTPPTPAAKPRSQQLFQSFHSNPSAPTRKRAPPLSAM